jgi:hypothetical protein
MEYWRCFGYSVGDVRAEIVGQRAPRLLVSSWPEPVEEAEP